MAASMLGFPLLRSVSRRMWWGSRRLHKGLEASAQEDRNEAARRRFDTSVISWFPGHMATATVKIESRIKAVDLVLEVRDARAPLSSACAQLQPLLKGKKRLIVLNKCDQVPEKDQILWEEYFTSRNHKVLFTDATNGVGITGLLPPSLKARGIVNVKENRSFVAMIIGVPNTGKSTLINALRRYGHKKKDGKTRTNSAVTGPLPGVTRHVSVIQFYPNPLAYLVDTPGVMNPQKGNGEAGLRLALTGAIKDAVLDIRELASYLLYVLNSRKAHDYVEKFGLDGPSDDITTVLQAVGLRMGYRISRKAAEMQGVADRTDTQDWVHFDLDKSATALVRLYRDGKLGKVVLDDTTDDMEQ